MVRFLPTEALAKVGHLRAPAFDKLRLELRLKIQNVIYKLTTTDISERGQNLSKLIEKYSLTFFIKSITL
jgi:hypothetical protein